MRKLLFIITITFSSTVFAQTASINNTKAARCSGGENCTACKNCNYCKNCNNGGWCSVCRPPEAEKPKKKVKAKPKDK